MRLVEPPPPPGIATDVVEYLVLVLPGPHSLTAIAPEIIRVADSPAVRVLDLVVVSLDEQNSPEIVELDTIPGLEGVRDSATRRRVLLSRHDIELVCLSLRAGECAIILVAEDRWAQPLAAAARALGGEVRAGERIARDRVEATLERAPEQPKEG